MSESIVFENFGGGQTDAADLQLADSFAERIADKLPSPAGASYRAGFRQREHAV